MGGACDGFLRNVPALMRTKYSCLRLSRLTINDSKNSRRYKTTKDGLRLIGQIHCYMGLFNVDKTMVIVVNKNDSNVYTEIIDFNPSIWEQAQERAERWYSATRSLTA